MTRDENRSAFRQKNERRRVHKAADRRAYVEARAARRLYPHGAFGMEGREVWKRLSVGTDGVR